MDRLCIFPNCDRQREVTSRSNWCPGHRKQRSRGQELRAIPPRMTMMERFWSKVEKTDTCWNWTGTTRFGYGQFSTGGRTGTKVLSHRFSYEMHLGPIPDGKLIDHVCHNRACINPEHLRPVSSKQNVENHNGPMRNNKVGIRGVCYDPKREKFVAQVGHNYRNYIVGRFDTAAEAEIAVLAKRLELHTHNDLDRTAA